MQYESLEEKSLIKQLSDDLKISIPDLHKRSVRFSECQLSWMVEEQRNEMEILPFNQ